MTLTLNLKERTMTPYSECENLLNQMLDLQRLINGIVDPHWRSARQQYYRAIWIESAELADHLGWKWWRQNECNMQQVHLELVDIFHFGLCDLLLRWPEDQPPPEAAVNAMTRLLRLRQPAPSENIFCCLEDFAGHCLQTRRFDIAAFCELAGQCGLSLHGLFKLYVAKNALNRLRQERGYQNGNYHKTWAGREDNEWLAELQASVPFSAQHYGTDIFAALSYTYDECQARGAVA